MFFNIQWKILVLVSRINKVASLQLSCKYCKIFKYSFFKKTPPVVASEKFTNFPRKYQWPRCIFLINTAEYDSMLLSLAKISSLVFWKSTGWIFFYYLLACISQMCMRMYIFCFKKYTHTNKKVSISLFVQIYVFFSFQKIKGKALCFSTKKRAVIVAF